MKKTTKTASVSKQRTKRPSINVQTSNDLRNAVLIVSLLFNLFVVALWLITLTTTKYDTALGQFLLNR